MSGGAADFWYPFRWTGFRPRAEALDEPVDFVGPPVDSTAVPVDSTAPQDSAAATPSAPAPAPAPAPPPRDTAVRRPPAGYTVSFAALLVADKARELAASIRVGSENARVVTAVRDGSTIYRVVLGPYPRARKRSASGASRSSPTGSTREDRERDAHDGLERGGAPNRRHARRVPRDRRRRHGSDRDRRDGARHRARAGGAPPRRGRRSARRRAAHPGARGRRRSARSGGQLRVRRLALQSRARRCRTRASCSSCRPAPVRSTTRSCSGAIGGVGSSPASARWAPC